MADSLTQSCYFCGQQVAIDSEETYREVRSWVNGPKLDGPKLREQTGNMAHKHCVDNLVAGQAVDQDTLLDENVPKGALHKEAPDWMKGFIDEL